jgi:hypothetical protein
LVDVQYISNKNHNYRWKYYQKNNIIEHAKNLYGNLLDLHRGPSWSWWHGSWFYNYLWNQCLSPLMLRVRNPLRLSVHDTNLCDKVCHWLATGHHFLNLLRFLPPKKLTATIYSQTSVPPTRMGRTLWMARTDLKVPSIFLIFLSKNKPFRSNTDISNSRTQ